MLQRRIAAATQIDVAQHKWEAGGGVQQIPQAAGGLEQLRNQHPAFGCVHDLAAAALKVAKRGPAVAIGGDRHLGPVPVALDLWRGQGRQDLLLVGATLFGDRIHQPTSLALELFSIRLAQQRAGAALDSVGTIDGLVRGGCHLRRIA
jgi:hypothetical protein